MTNKLPDETPEVQEIQLAYATFLNANIIIGFSGLVVGFILYIFGFVPAYLPREEMPKYWVMSAHEYLEAANISAGWGWLDLIQKGDFMNFAGIAFLSTVTIFCYLRILPILLKNKDFIYSTIVIFEVFILTFAASGIFTSSH